MKEKQFLFCRWLNNKNCDLSAEASQEVIELVNGTIDSSVKMDETGVPFCDIEVM